MLYFIGTIVGKRTIWEGRRYDDLYLDDGISIAFPLPYQLPTREALNYLKTHLPQDEKEWLFFTDNNWTINLDVFRSKYGEAIDKMIQSDNQVEDKDLDMLYFDSLIESKITMDLFTGVLAISPEVTQQDHTKETKTTVSFIFTYEDLMNAKPQKIFLSHKSADKPIVREYKDILVTLGFDPWLDEEDLIAGDKLHRGILEGFNKSCAAIFFITPNYVDDKYLATEIDYAINQVYEKGSNFRIITLVLNDPDNLAKVPELLKQYVYKTPTSHISALKEIIRALPLKLGSPKMIN